MTLPSNLRSLSVHSAVLAGMLAAWGLIGPAPASAAIVISGDAVTVGVGSTANTLDVTLTNSGPAPISLAGFTLGLSVSYPEIALTGATSSTVAPYVFDADSLFAPDLGSGGGLTLTVSDILATPSTEVTVSAGATVGLARLLFDVSANAAAGSYALSFAPFPTSSLSDDSANAVTVDTLAAGNITIEGTTPVPEPSSLLLVFSATMLLPLARKARSWRPKACPISR